MKAMFEGVEIEGTPDEIAEYIRNMRHGESGMAKLVRATRHDAGIIRSSSHPNQKADIEEEKFCRLALRRRPLSAAQQDLLGALARNYPEWTSFTQLQEATSYSERQLSGLFGAFSRRLGSTRGYREDRPFLEWKWGVDGKSCDYRLSESAYDAVRDLRL